MGKEKDLKIHVMSHVLRKHGIYNFGAAHNAVKTWLRKHKYDFYEKKHYEKEPKSKYMELIWVAERYVNDYVKFNIKVEIWMRNAKPVEGGKMQGRVEFIFNSDMEKNVDIKGVKKFSTAEKGNFMDFIREFYEKYIIKSRLEDLETKLFEETKDLIENIRLALV